jgi:hypothetical protein
MLSRSNGLAPTDSSGNPMPLPVDLAATHPNVM